MAGIYITHLVFFVRLKCKLELLRYLYPHGLELLPAGTVGQSYHEVIVAGVYIIGDVDVKVRLVCGLSCGDDIVLREYPGVNGFLLSFPFALRGRGAVGVVVEVVVYLDIEVAQFCVVGKHIAELYVLTSLIHLAVYGVGYADACDDGVGHIRTAARTECAQRYYCV